MAAHIWALTVKEFLALLRDKVSRMALIVPPILQLVVFGYAASFDLNHVPYAIYNEDSGAASRDFLARFAGAEVFRPVAEVTSDAQAARLLESRDVLLVLHLGPHFTRDLLLHRSASVQAIIDGRNSNTASIALNYVSAIAQGFNEQWAADHGWGRPPAMLKIRAWYNPNLLSRWFIVPGIVGLLTLVVALVVTSLSVAREREAGTFDQLLVTPYRPFEILIGKALPGLIVGLLEGTGIVLIAVLWFHVPLLGSLAALYLGLIFFLMSAVGVGLMISAAAATQQQGLLGAFLFLVPAVILSGFATPIANMPPTVQTLTYLNPMRYFLVILRGVFLEGDGVSLLWSQYLPLAAIGLLTMAAAAWLFRHRLY